MNHRHAAAVVRDAAGAAWLHGRPADAGWDDGELCCRIALRVDEGRAALARPCTAGPRLQLLDLRCGSASVQPSPSGNN